MENIFGNSIGKSNGGQKESGNNGVGPQRIDDRIGKMIDENKEYNLPLYGEGEPLIAPRFFGDSYYDTTDHIAYVSYGTEVTDWETREGNYTYSLVNGVNTRIYAKYFYGSTDSTGTLNIAHGLYSGNIMDVSLILNKGLGFWVSDSYRYSTSETRFYELSYDNTNIIITNGMGFWFSLYRLKIEYR